MTIEQKNDIIIKLSERERRRSESKGRSERRERRFAEPGGERKNFSKKFEKELDKSKTV